MADNVMKKIKVEKLTLNVGAGANQDAVERAAVLLEKVSGKKPVQTQAKKRIASWGIRPGLPIGAKITIRGKEAKELLLRLLKAVEMKISEKSFTENGFSFGVKEYIDIEGVKYDPKLPISGLDVCVSLARPGYRISKRKINPTQIPKSHKISKEDAMEFAKTELGVTVE